MKTKLYKILAYLICLIASTFFYLTVITTSFITALIFGLITNVAFGASIYLSKKNKYLAYLPSIVLLSTIGGCIAFFTKDIKSLVVLLIIGIALETLEYVSDRFTKDNKYLNLILNVITFLAIGGSIAFITKDIETIFEFVIIVIIYSIFSRPKVKKNDYPIPPLNRI